MTSIRRYIRYRRPTAAITVGNIYAQCKGNVPALFIDAIRAKQDSCRALNTRRHYATLLRFFIANFGDQVRCSDIDRRFVLHFAETVGLRKASRPAMGRLLCSWFAAVCRHAMERGLIPADLSLRMRLPSARPVDRHLLPEDQEALIAECRRLVTASNSDRNSASVHAAAIFLLDIALQGLAPVDLAEITVGMFLPDRAGTVWIVETRRRKTGVPVRIVIDREAAAPLLEPLLRNRRPDEYLIDCFQRDKEYTETQRQNRIANYFHKLATALPRVSGRQVTLYYARRIYCDIVDSLDIPHHQLRKLIGHAPGVLERHYLRPLSLAEHRAISRALLLKLLG